LRQRDAANLRRGHKVDLARPAKPGRQARKGRLVLKARREKPAHRDPQGLPANAGWTARPAIPNINRM
jgi:hypothetical protein